MIANKQNPLSGLHSYRELTRHVDAQNWPAGGAALNRIRQLVATNLVLGLITIGVAVLGGLLG